MYMFDLKPSNGSGNGSSGVGFSLSKPNRAPSPAKKICDIEVLDHLQREVAGSLQPFNMRTSRMKFSSDSGDLIDAVVPFMGESISDGTLAKFLKQPGDKVDVDEPIAQVETDKEFNVLVNLAAALEMEGISVFHFDFTD